MRKTIVIYIKICLLIFNRLGSFQLVLFIRYGFLLFSDCGTLLLGLTHFFQFIDLYVFIYILFTCLPLVENSL